ncbi:leucine-rich repeat and IQ domain-containing protein 1 [Anguilla rostrata]|uniref:leucine-rich repeat and IQ domain-containing protein 1 n=1 Tax=Anguilla rostrata TaxID=7938 RepID=UPI0030CF3AC1
MDDDKLIEEDISQELSKLNESNVDSESETSSEAEDLSDGGQVIHEIPESVLSCFQLERDRLNSIERLLMEEPEEKSTVKDGIRGVTPNNCEDFLKELASECGEDLITLKKRVISEIEEEETKSVLCTEDAQTASKGNTTELVPDNDEDSDEYLETERQFRTELMNLERRLKTEEEERLAEHKVTKERLQKARKEEEERRMRRHRFFEEELKRIEYDNMVQQHLELGSKDGKINGRISKELSKQQELITGLQKHVVEERQAFEEVQAEQSKKIEEKQCRAATKIQASVRAFLVRTKNAMALSEKREERRLKKEVQLRLEQERKEKEEKIRKKLEELKIRREEEERRKEEERIRWKEEKKRREEERIRQKEEKKRQEEDRIRLEEKKRREEEARIRLEEEKRREEEARIRLEEEKRREEEARIRLEEEKRREEEARIRLEEEKRRKEEARIRLEEEKRREEEARIRLEEEKRREEEERRKKEEEDQQKRERIQKQEEEARKRKEEEIRKQEKLERQQRIEEEERQQREIEERKAEELRKQEEEERERSSMEESQEEEEILIPGEKENPYCLSAESEKEMFHASNSMSSSEGLERGRKRPESGDTVSEANQSEEEQCHWRLKCFYRASRSSVSSSPDEMRASVSSGDAVEAGQQQREGPPFLGPDKAGAEDSERLVSSASTPLSDGAEQKCVEWVKDFTPWAKPSPQTKRRPVLKTAIVRRGSAKSLPPPAADSVVQSASWNSHSEELNAGQLEHTEEGSAEAGQRGLAEHTETRDSNPAFLVCKKSAAAQDDRRDEWRKTMEQQTEQEREEKEERARKKALEQRRRKEEEERERCAAEEEERQRLETERRREEEEGRRQRESEEREAKELEEQGESETRREESRKEKKEPVPEDRQLPRPSGVKAAELAPVPDPGASSGEPAPAEGSRAGGSEPPEAGSERPSSSLMCLPDGAERKRLEWMKDCVPWTKLSLLNKRKQAPRAKTARRGSVKALPPLSIDTILQSAAWSSLKQVTTVTLEDLPGCSLSTLSECTKLQALSLRRCGLLALEGLSACRGLRHIDLQENEIKFVNCKDLSKLQVLLLSRNQLTSIHGLEDAVNLDVLELSHNRISRLGGLESQKRLQRLLIDHNQLISTRGLSELYTLLYLDCGYNHLTSMGDIENCALLSTLKLQGNNLTEPPSLKNHILMKELYLDDNIVSSLDSLSVCWLPLLQLISASKNSITHLPPLSDCVSLERLDISHNCLSELENVRHSLKGCSQLQEINLSGNPFQQESNWRSALLQTVPGLRRVNGEWISSTAPPSGRADTPPPGSFLGFCRAQLQQLERVQRRHEAQLSAPSPLDVPTIISQHCQELLLLAEEQRYAHEFGDLTVTDRAEPVSSGRRLDLRALPASAAEASEQNAAGGASCSREAEGSGGTPSSVPEPSAGTSGEDAGSQRGHVTSDRCTDPLQKHAKDKPSKKPSRKFDLKNMAAVVIQSFWRGHRCRRAAVLHAAARVVRGDGVAAERVSEEARPDQCRAATVIQAAWKGYVLRKRLASALAAVRVAEADEEFAEVDMDEFSFDEAALDRDWITLDSERSPPKTLPSRDRAAWPKPPVYQYTQRTSSSALPWQPRQAWPGGESERAALSGRRSVSPEIIELTHRTKSPLACVFGPPKEKSEKIMKEWGLSDRYTAQLMLKRAQKMKPKKKKDRRSGDPAAYLDLFRNSENKQAPVKVPKRSQPEKTQPFKDCFVAGEEDFDEQKRISSEWTDLWLQTQANNPDTDRTSPALESEHFLPEIDVDILNGRRVQLVSVSALPRCCQAGPGLRDGPDQESGSRASAAALSPPRREHNQTRANAAGHARREAPAPVQAASGPSKKERISFRDNPVQLSLGWGGGKKRSTLRK